MTGTGSGPPIDRARSLLDGNDTGAAEDELAALRSADVEARKALLRGCRELATERPDAFDGLVAPLASFLEDDERAVRLSTAKLFVAIAERNPDGVRDVVPSLAERLGDDGAFYYVRARCAEALGYVALEYPSDVSDPAVLAELRVGLELDEAAVREKLAKALAGLAVGDPSRLRYRVDALAAHLDDDEVLVRYHLCTALAESAASTPPRSRGRRTRSRHD